MKSENKTKPRFERENYEGAFRSTLCLGCGHDQISKHIITAFYEAQVDPFLVAKMSGIGCSSKTPSYFLKQAKGFNGIHGRMACLATGVKSANRNLKVLGVSGDGDTGSIGLGSFLHSIRQNIPMLYIMENNGVYGLTKGQFSVTAMKESQLKKRKENSLENLDLCDLALSAGCGFVARSFSGDAKQLTALIKLALSYKGFAFIDVISPCVAYGNEKDFAHSFSFMKERKWPLHELDILFEEELRETRDQDSFSLPLPDGSFMILKKIENHNPSKKDQAQAVLREKLVKEGKRIIPTGLIYYEEKEDFFDRHQLTKTALVDTEDKAPQSKVLDHILQHYS